MIIQSDWQASLDFFDSKPIVVEPQQAQLTSDAGLLPIRQLDEQLGLTAQLAAALHDPRNPAATTHPYLQMVRTRIYGILAGYADQNDHDVLRYDPLFKLVAGRSPDGQELASQPTLSRFENAIDVASLRRLQDVLIDQFIASFSTPPLHLTFDIDVFDDPTHGNQQLTFFHGYYDQYQYLPRAITCQENDLVVMVCLLFGTAHAALGIEDDLTYLVERLRKVWPDVRIILRGDSGFAVPKTYTLCEELRVDYTIGLGMNPVLKRRSDELLQEAVRKFEETHQPQRLFTAFWYQAASWPIPRWTVVKAEAHEQGTNRRAVVTNRPGATVFPQATYDEYTERGESENRNKELKCGLEADRLSDHRYMANLFRLYLHTVAANLLVRLRGVVANPPSPQRPTELPTEALAGKDRRDYFNHRREQDPLGEAHPCTWRTRLIKVAAEIVVSARRVVVRLASSWPYLEHYRQVVQAVLRLQAKNASGTG
jgi:Transposase DDE domain group 1